MSTKDIPKAVGCEQAAPLEPTPSKLDTHEEVRCITEIVKCLEFKREDPNESEHTGDESHEIPSIPPHVCVHFRREQLSPVTPQSSERMVSQYLFQCYNGIKRIYPR